MIWNRTMVWKYIKCTWIGEFRCHWNCISKVDSLIQMQKIRCIEKTGSSSFKKNEAYNIHFQKEEHKLKVEMKSDIAYAFSICLFFFSIWGYVLHLISHRYLSHQSFQWQNPPNTSMIHVTSHILLLDNNLSWFISHSH